MIGEAFCPILHEEEAGKAMFSDSRVYSICRKRTSLLHRFGKSECLHSPTFEQSYSKGH